jgi:hypothetical protein
MTTTRSLDTPLVIEDRLAGWCGGCQGPGLEPTDRVAARP